MVRVRVSDRQSGPQCEERRTHNQPGSHATVTAIFVRLLPTPPPLTLVTKPLTLRGQEQRTQRSTGKGSDNRIDRIGRPPSSDTCRDVCPDDSCHPNYSFKSSKDELGTHRSYKEGLIGSLGVRNNSVLSIRIIIDSVSVCDTCHELS